MEDIRFCIEARFASAAAADHKHVEVTAMLASVQPDLHMICEKDVLIAALVCVLVIDFLSCTPFCGAVFFTVTVILPCCKVNADAHPIHQQK